MMPARPVSACSSSHSATFASHGHRSSSSSWCPEAILSTLAAGCRSSPSSKSHPKRPASSPATVDFPQPETPINTNTGGCPGDPLTIDTILTSTCDSATPSTVYPPVTRRTSPQRNCSSIGCCRAGQRVGFGGRELGHGHLPIRLRPEPLLGGVFAVLCRRATFLSGQHAVLGGLSAILRGSLAVL